MKPYLLTAASALLLSAIAAPAEARVYYSSEPEPYCREFTQNVSVGNRRQEGYGTACLQPDGSWEMVSEEQRNYRRVEPDYQVIRDSPRDRDYAPYSPYIDINFGINSDDRNYYQERDWHDNRRHRKHKHKHCDRHHQKHHRHHNRHD